MKTCGCLRRVIVIDLYNDDCILSVRYKLRLWFSVGYELRLCLIIMLGIEIVCCEVCTEAVVHHYAGDSQCHLCGMD
jgi:hypothetical protein